MIQKIHDLIGDLMIAAGPKNPLVLFFTRRDCAKRGASLSWYDKDRLILKKRDQGMLLAPKHIVYAPDMATRFEMYFSPLRPTRIGDVDVLDYSRPGVLQTYKRSGLQFEMASFPEEDETIEEYFRWYTPQPGEVVFDIGAHCGVSAYYFSKQVGERGKVIAFEPDPINYALLLRNVERHKLSNVVCVQKAIAGQRGMAEFNSEGTIGSNLKRVSSRSTVGATVQVETLSLIDAFAQWGTPAFCKIDIEGAEIEAVSAAVEALRGKRIQFVLDTNHLLDGELTDKRIENLFRNAGYESESRAGTTWARPGELVGI